MKSDEELQQFAKGDSEWADIDDVAEIAKELIQMRSAMETIRRVASGERQVATDDTEGMAWINTYAHMMIATGDGEVAEETCSHTRKE